MTEVGKELRPEWSEIMRWKDRRDAERREADRRRDPGFFEVPNAVSLSDMRAVLDFENQHFVRHGAKEAAIHRTFGVSAARYYQALNRFMDTPEALEYDPILIHALQRRRTERVRALASRTFTKPRQLQEGT